MRTAALYSLFAAMATAYSFGDGEVSSFWVVAIAALVIIGLWASIPMAMSESSGLPVDQLLTPDEKSSFQTKLILSCIASVLGGLIVGFAALG